MTEPHLDHTAPKTLRDIPISILDLAPITAGDTAHSRAKYARSGPACREVGYNRYWLAEHHNMPGIASSATSVVIGHVAGGTSKIRVGAGGIMRRTTLPWS